MSRPLLLTPSQTSKPISLLLIYALTVFLIGWPTLATTTAKEKVSEKHALSKSKKENCPSCQAATEGADLADRIDRLAIIGRTTQLNPLLSIQRSIFDGLQVNFVNTATGQLAFAVDDLAIAGSMPLFFRRVYASDFTEDRGLGKGWSFIFDDRIRIDGEAATLITGDGRQVDFQADASRTHFKLKTAEPSVYQSFDLGKDVLTEQTASLTRVYKKFKNDYRLSRIVDANDNSIDIEFDGGGQIQRIRTSGGTISLEWSAGEAPRLLAITDSAGRRVTYQQDRSGLRFSKDATGAQWGYDYVGGRLTQAVDPLGRVLLRAGYGRNGRTVTSGDGAGTNQFAYSSSSSVISRRTVVTDPLGVTTVFEHDAQGALTGTFQDGEVLLQAEYNSAHRLSRLSNQGGAEELFSFDAQNRLVQSSSSAGSLKTYTYDEGGRISAVVEEGIRTDYTRDARGNIVSARSSDPARSYRAEVDRGGRVLNVESEAGRRVTNEYNDAGNLIAFSTRESGRFQTELDGVGQVAVERFPSGLTERYERDARGMLTRKSDNQGRATSFERDQSGSLAKIARADGTWVGAQRDPAGRIVALNSSSGKTRRFAYDPRGGLTDYTDSLGRHTNFSYDQRGRVESFEDNEGNKTLIQRDPKSGRVNRLSRLDQSGRRQDFDRAGRPIGGISLLAGLASRTQLDGPRYNAHAVLAPLVDFECLFGPDPSFDAGENGYNTCWDPFGPFGDDGYGNGDGPNTMTHQQCVSRQRLICLNKQTSCVMGAAGSAAVAIAACAIAGMVSPNAGIVCALAAALKYQTDLFTCGLNYANCMLAVESKCAAFP